MGSKRGIAASITLLIALGGCAGETVPAPETTGPSGALYGRVIDTRGEVVTDADVSLFQLSSDDKVRTGFAMLSLGLFCLSPGFCPAPVNAELSSQGYYSFPERVMKETPGLALTATRPANDDQRTSASVSVALRDGRDPQRAPDLVLWEPEVQAGEQGTSAKVSWPRLSAAAPHGPDVSYSVWVRALDSSASEQRVAGPVKGTSATFDLRPYEDQPTEVTVLASTKAAVDGHEVELGYRSAGHELPLLEAPPSRDKRCLADGKPVKAPCALTDGDLDTHSEILASGECSVDTRTCEPVTHERLCVDLGQAREVSLIVFRTPFELGAEDIRVEVSSDGRSFDTVGRGKEQQVVAVPVRPARSARFACVHDKFSGHQLSELSVW
jgi:hypothetical protein